MVVLIAALNLPYTVEFEAKVSRNSTSLQEQEKEWKSAEHSHNSIVRAQADDQADAVKQRAEVPFDFAEQTPSILHPQVTKSASIPPKSIVDTRRPVDKKAAITVNMTLSRDGSRAESHEAEDMNWPNLSRKPNSANSPSSNASPSRSRSLEPTREAKLQREKKQQHPLSASIIKDLSLSGRRSQSPSPQRGLNSLRKRAPQHNLLTVPGTPLDQPWHIVDMRGSNRGLFNAVETAIDDEILKSPKFVGLLGISTDIIAPTVKRHIGKALVDTHRCYPVYMSDAEIQGHYDNYCKEFLWPTFHCQVPDIPTSKDYEDHSWGDYYAVNKAIADEIVRVYEEGDIIWIHDYHLMLVPEMVREKLPKAAIGFFMHIAFPTSEVFRCLAYRTELIKGLLAANMVGFQIEEYVQHFIMTAARILAVDSSNGRIETNDHDVVVKAFPIGIDIDKLNWFASSDQTGQAMEEHRQVIRKRWPTQRLIAARDKFDTIRGLTQKLKAYELFLQMNPEWAQKVVLVQICLPSGNNSSEIDGSGLASLADYINSRYGDLAAGIQPLVLLRQDVRFEQYMALLAEADGFIITCLREGMNLTCHEYVSINQRMGPLILSEFTGSASVFNDDALLVNPWNVKQVANSFLEVLQMGPSEKSHRSRRMLESIKSHPGKKWVEKVVHCIQTAWEEEMTRTWVRPTMSHLREVYQSATGGPRLFLLEMEPRASRKENVNQRSYYASRLPFTIRTLSENPDNIVYLLSAESQSYLERVYRQHPGLGLIAESGRYIRYADSEEWYDLGEIVENRDWHQEIAPMTQRMQERNLVQEVAEHESSIVITLTPGDTEDRELSVIGEYTSVINDTFADVGVRCKLENNKLIIYTNDFGRLRVRAYQRIMLRINKPISLMMIASQGFAAQADDSLFDWAEEQKVLARVNELVTIVLGKHPTQAYYMVEGVNALLSTLQAMIAKGD